MHVISPDVEVHGGWYVMCAKVCGCFFISFSLHLLPGLTQLANYLPGPQLSNSSLL